MSGETSENVSAWTIDSLKEHLDDRLVELDRRYEQRFQAQEVAMAAALAAAEKAVNKAETAAEKRFEAVNEFRGQLSDQTQTFVPRAEYGVAHAALETMFGDQVKRTTDALSRINSRLDLMQGNTVGMKAAVGIIVAVITIAATIISSVVLLAK